MAVLTGAFFVVLSLVLTAVKGDCDSIPVIPNTYHNGTSGPFTEGYVVQYSCNTGFSGVGSRIYVCSGNNFVGNFACERNCGRHDHPINGRIVGNPEYKVGTRIEFSCNNGYEIQGSSSLLCRADGKWRPLSAPTCTPVDCGSFGTIANADLFQENPDGVLNDYKSVVYVTCDEGYVLEGSPTVTCLASGSWDLKPSCKPSDCGQHPAMKTKCIKDSSLSSDGSVLNILCLDSTENRSVTVTGSGSAFCFDNQWDELDMGCVCDCTVDNVEGVVYSNLVRNKFVKHNTALRWGCKPGYSKSKMSVIMCNDGEMDRPTCTKHKTPGGQNGTDDDLDDIKCEAEHWFAIVLCFIVAIVNVIVFLVYLVLWCMKHEQEKKYSNFQWWYWLLMAIGIVIAIGLCIVAGLFIQCCKYLEHAHMKVGRVFEIWQLAVMIILIAISVVLYVGIGVVIEKFTDKGETDRPKEKECVPLNENPTNVAT